MIQVTKFKALQDIYIVFKDDLELFDMVVASTKNLATYAEEGEVFTWVPEEGSYYSESGANLSAHWFQDESEWKPIQWKEVEKEIA